MIEELKQEITDAKKQGNFEKAKNLELSLIELYKIPKKNKKPKVNTP